MIAGILGVKPLIEYVDAHSNRPGHDRRYALHGDELPKLGWNPPRPFDQSFRETVLELAK